MIAMRRAATALLVSIAAMTAVAGCGGSSSSETSATAAGGDVVRMWIGPDLVDCVGVAPQKCMQVAYEEGGAPEFFYSSIEGFEYVEGTSYVIDVEITEDPNPPADASSLNYTLVEVISETP